MKKLSILLMMSVLAGCSNMTSATCLDGMCGDDEETTVTPSRRTNYNQVQDYRQPDNMYVYRSQQPRPVIVYRQPEPRPTPVYEVQVQETRQNPIIVQSQAPVQTVVMPRTTVVESNNIASCGDLKTTVSESTLPDSSSPCPSQIKEVKEPVEIVYKKTTYKTVYEPKTTSSVSYEKQPYQQVQMVQTVQTAQPQMYETVVTTTTTTTDTMPADEIK